MRTTKYMLLERMSNHKLYFVRETAASQLPRRGPADVDGAPVCANVMRRPIG